MERSGSMDARRSVAIQSATLLNSGALMGSLLETSALAPTGCVGSCFKDKILPGIAPTRYSGRIRHP